MNYDYWKKQVEELIFDNQFGDSPAVLPLDSFVSKTIATLSEPSTGPKADDWEAFTKMFGGFRPKEFTVLCGTTGTGKTAFLANVSAQLMTGRTPHFVASVETGPEDYTARVLSVLEGKDLTTGDPIDRKELEAIFAKWKILFERKMLHFVPYWTKIQPMNLLCDLLYARRELGCKVAFIDNLNFLLPIVNQTESISSMDQVLHNFIIFCKRIDIHIVMVMHPRKKEDADGATRVESEYDIKGSSTVVQEASNVLLLNRPTKNQQRDGYGTTCRELKFAKLRRRGIYTGQKIMFEKRKEVYFERQVFENA